MIKALYLSVTASIVLLLASPAAADAGVIRKTGAKIAVTSAGQSYELTYVPENETDRRLGMGAALFLEWFDLPVISLVTQLEYLPRGMDQQVNVTGPEGPEVIGTTTIENRLDYLSLPILAKGRLDLGSVTPYALAGVRFDYLLGYDSEYGAFDLVYSAFDKSTIGASVGAGIELNELLPFGLLAEVRYNLDLEDAYSTDLLKVSNNSYDFWIGVTF
jgi:hypothetical protein